MNQELYNQGLEKARQKDYTGAIGEFSRALEEDPDFAEAYLQRGLAYYDSGATLQAVSDYNEVLKLNPESVQAYYSRALARMVLKNLPGALADVDQAIRLNLDYAAGYNLRGILRRKEGNIQDAIANFKKAAELYLKQKDTENCRECLVRIKQLQSPAKPLPVQATLQAAPIISEKEYFTQLLEQAENGETREAIESLNWVLQIDPQDGQAYCCRGIVRCKQEYYRDAISDFNQALRLNFSDAIVYRNRGRARSLIGDNTGAIADFNQALQMQGDDALVYTARGNAYRAMGNHYGAIKDYTQALQLNPDDGKAYYNRGISHTCLEEMERAIEDYQSAASKFCEQEDWQNYHQVLNSLKKINSSIPASRKAKYSIIRQRLLRMVGGYWEIAERLIDQAKYNYPGMSDDWYLEKVIGDLERDRGM
jgi:tetratricopeptide (TPR) repeat protein